MGSYVTKREFPPDIPREFTRKIRGVASRCLSGVGSDFATQRADFATGGFEVLAVREHPESKA
jgi:hypothetical protein